SSFVPGSLQSTSRHPSGNEGGDSQAAPVRGSSKVLCPPAQMWYISPSSVSSGLRMRSSGSLSVTVAYDATECVSQTFDPTTAWWPITVLPPRIVAFAYTTTWSSNVG